MCCAERKRRASESIADSNEEIPAEKRRRRTFSEGEKPTMVKHQRRTKHTEELATESSAVKTDDVPEEKKQEGRCTAADGEQVTGRKDRKRKRSSVQSTTEQECDSAVETAKAGANSAKKLKTQGEGSATKAADGVYGSRADPTSNRDCKQSKPRKSTEDASQSVEKTKRANKLRKEKKRKAEPPRLRVISKLVVLASTLYCNT